MEEEEEKKEEEEVEEGRALLPEDREDEVSTEEEAVRGAVMEKSIEENRKSKQGKNMQNRWMGD